MPECQVLRTGPKVTAEAGHQSSRQRYARGEPLAARRQAAAPFPDGARYERQAAFRAFWTERFAAGDGGVVRWRYSWGDGHIRGVDVFTVRDGICSVNPNGAGSDHSLRYGRSARRIASMPAALR